MNRFYVEMNMPESNKIDKKINKEIFINRSESYLISNSLKMIFIKYIDEISISYIIKDKKTKDDLLYLSVDINNPMCIYDIANVLGRTLLYSIVILINYKGRTKIGLIRNRENKKSNSSNTIIDITFSGWLKNKKSIGRRDDLIKNLYFDKFANLSNDEKLDKYYRILKAYEAKHVDLEDAINLIKQLKLPFNKNIKKDILINCISVKVDANIKNRIELFNSSRLDKYVSDDYNKFMICCDELYCYLKEQYESFRYTYSSYYDYLKSLYKENRIENSKVKRSNELCEYYDSTNNICTYSMTYLDECIGSCKCTNYLEIEWRKNE